MSETLVATEVTISKHALDRYMERRKWQAGREGEACLAIREILSRIDGKQAPISQARTSKSFGRRIAQGELMLVFSTDYKVLITFYERKPRSVKRAGSRKGNGRPRD